MPPDLMTPQDLLLKLPMVPYEPEGQDMRGLDCFGLVEIWHKFILGIEIDDRQARKSHPRGFASGYTDAKHWLEIGAPIDHCVVVMRSMLGSRVIDHGHCGIYYGGFVHHLETSDGFECVPIREIEHRITDLRIHQEI